MMTYEEQLQAIAQPPHPGAILKNQKGMSYLEAFYVRLTINRIFGPTSVSVQALDLRPVQDFMGTDKYDKARLETEYIASITLRVLFANGEHRIITGTGGGTGYGRTAHQDAAKEAESDAIKRACTHLGPAFGTTLYDKNNPLHEGGPCRWIGYQTN
ncbi:MAG TPA: hypothetical protein EYN66_18475, partial [Myxococcales bacterium]|nr:hypothetical protein [Myxococcales bacterium]